MILPFHKNVARLDFDVINDRSLFGSTKYHSLTMLNYPEPCIHARQDDFKVKIKVLFLYLLVTIESTRATSADHAKFTLYQVILISTYFEIFLIFSKLTEEVHSRYLTWEGLKVVNDVELTKLSD
jgi:hypothetical protein